MVDLLNQHCIQSTKVNAINKIITYSMEEFLNQHCLQSSKVSTINKNLF
jgi:hypothetical protein